MYRVCPICEKCEVTHYTEGCILLETPNENEIICRMINAYSIIHNHKYTIRDGSNTQILGGPTIKILVMPIS